jgi:hypothetical protein
VETIGLRLQRNPSTLYGGLINDFTRIKKPDSSGGSREPSDLEQVGIDAPTLYDQPINAFFYTE